ncbi:MAG: HupE/UreJ family protein, partial [Thermoanaerobaculia bacterium]
ALSIVYVAVENVVSPRLRASRLVLVFVFGLLHGLGFAGVLGELGLPEGRRLSALLAFNVGVELGQLAIIAGAVVLLAVWTRLGSRREALVKPASIAIAAMGLFWFVQRLIAP